MTEIFTQFSIIIGLAVIIAIIMKVLKQPLMIGYIITGVLVGPTLLNLVRQGSEIELFSSLGVSLLLFIVGLGLDPKMIKDVGAVSVAVGIGQIIFTSVLGLGIGLLLGFSLIPALYLAVAFTFSSTIIILGLLYEKQDQDTLYGRISIGMLLVQDLVAMLIFVFLSSMSQIGSSNIFIALTWILIKFAVIILVTYGLIKFVVPKVDIHLAKNRQLLFLFSISICFITASLFHALGFSLELGALLAGIMLSTSPYNREIATRIQPLRDFFLVTFFIYLGAQINLAGLVSNIWIIIVYSLFILVGNPLIVLFIMTIFGHTRRTAFFTGLTVAQISEFSLIMLGIGVSVGHISLEIVGPATIVGLLTIACSSYMMTYNRQIYHFLEPIIRFITPYAHDRGEKKSHSKSVEVLLFGAHRLGGGIMQILLKKAVNFLVIDHDPSLVSHLKSEGFPAEFGSADDMIFLDELDCSKTKVVISTIPDIEVNELLVNYFNKNYKNIAVVCVANYYEHVERLYRMGASYVVTPPYLGRRFMQDLFKRNLFNKKRYVQEKNRQLKDLKYLIDVTSL